jgi:hypothetical protein
MAPMKHLKTLVYRNIEHAEQRQKEVMYTDEYSSRYWDGYISALKSIVHVLPEDQD